MRHGFVCSFYPRPGTELVTERKAVVRQVKISRVETVTDTLLQTLLHLHLKITGGTSIMCFAVSGDDPDLILNIRSHKKLFDD